MPLTTIHINSKRGCVYFSIWIISLTLRRLETLRLPKADLPFPGGWATAGVLTIVLLILD